MPGTEYGLTQEMYIIYVFNSYWKVKIGGRRGNFTSSGSKSEERWLSQGKPVTFVEGTIMAKGKAVSDTYRVSVCKVLASFNWTFYLFYKMWVIVVIVYDEEGSSINHCYDYCYFPIFSGFLSPPDGPFSAPAVGTPTKL